MPDPYAGIGIEVNEDPYAGIGVDVAAPAGQPNKNVPPNERNIISAFNTPIADVTPTVERFKAGVGLGARGMQSLAQVPGVSTILNLPGRIAEGIGFDRDKIGMGEVQPRAILPEVPEKIPYTDVKIPGVAKSVLAAGRAFVDPIVGAGATLLGPITALTSPAAQVGDPVRRAVKKVIPGTPGEIASETAGGLAEAGVTFGVGAGMQRAASPFVKQAGRVIGIDKEPVKPTVRINPGESPQGLPNPEAWAERLGRMAIPKYKRDAEAVSLQAEMQGQKALAQMRSERNFSDLSQQAKDIARKAGKSPEDVGLEMGRALKGEQASPEVMAAVRPAREQINALQQEAAKVGLVSQELVDETVNIYTNRAYLSKISPDSWAPPPDVLERGRAYLKLRMRVNAADGTFRQATDDEVSGVVEKILGGEDKGVFIQSRGGARIELGPFTPRKDIPKPIRELMGEIEEGPAIAALTTLRLSNAVASKKFLDAFAKGSEAIEGAGAKQIVPWISETRIPGYVRVPEGRAWGPISGKFVLEKYAEDLKGLVGEMAPDGPIGRTVGHLMNTFKVSKTVLNPATHARNVLGNTMFADFANIPVTDPRNAPYFAKAASELLRSGKGAPARAVRRRHGGDVTPEGVSPIVREAISSGAIGTEFLGNEIMRQVADGFSRQNPMRAMWEQMKRPVRALGRVYNAEDQIFKLASYMKQRELGMSPREAARHVNEWFPNYRDVAPVVKKTRESIVGAPFVTFFSEAARISVKAAKDHPVKLAKWFLLPNMITAAAAANVGMNEDQWKQTQASIPSYLRQPMTVLWPTRTEDGNVQIFDMTYVHPLGSILAEERTGRLDLPLVGQFVLNNPILNTAISIMENQKFGPLKGRPVVAPGQSEAEGWATQIAQQFLPSLTPPIPGVTAEGGTSAREIGKAIRRAGGERAPGRYGQSPSLPATLANELGPIRVVPVDPALRTSAAKEKVGDISDFQRGISSIANEYASGRIGRSQFIERRDRFLRQFRQDLNKMRP